jgi:lauroyl/myristoyl acyltransferase
VIAGIYAYNSHLRWTQWIGVAAIILTVTLLPVQRRRKMVALKARDAALAPT